MHRSGTTVHREECTYTHQIRLHHMFPLFCPPVTTPHVSYPRHSLFHIMDMLYLEMSRVTNFIYLISPIAYFSPAPFVLFPTDTVCIVSHRHRRSHLTSTADVTLSPTQTRTFDSSAAFLASPHSRHASSAAAQLPPPQSWRFFEHPRQRALVMPKRIMSMPLDRHRRHRSDMSGFVTPTFGSPPVSPSITLTRDTLTISSQTPEASRSHSRSGSTSHSRRLYLLSHFPDRSRTMTPTLARVDSMSAAAAEEEEESRTVGDRGPAPLSDSDSESSRLPRPAPTRSKLPTRRIKSAFGLPDAAGERSRGNRIVPGDHGDNARLNSKSTIFAHTPTLYGHKRTKSLPLGSFAGAELVPEPDSIRVKPIHINCDPPKSPSRKYRHAQATNLSPRARGSPSSKYREMSIDLEPPESPSAKYKQTPAFDFSPRARRSPKHGQFFATTADVHRPLNKGDRPSQV